MDFLSFDVLDVIDILLVATLFYQLYRLIKGTAAMNIFVGIAIIYLFWIIVKTLNMELITTVLGQVIGVGVIALVIVFQQEIRKFLLYLGSKYSWNLDKRMTGGTSNENNTYIDDVITACNNMSLTNTGALIVFARKSDLNIVQSTGDFIDAKISSRLVENIFYKNSPLHDGAMIISAGRIVAARCVLPSTEKVDIQGNLGMRHRAALGISEQTDAVVVVVSEQTGVISYVESGVMTRGLSSVALKEKLIKVL